VKTVREAVGDEVNIRLDPNEAWTAKTAMKMSEKLARYDLECLEQPVPSRDIDGLAKIARSVETPVMAHQSLSSSPKALELIEKEAADMFNVCPAWYGLCEAKTIVGIAEAAGIPCCIGSSIDLGIADACHTHLGASSKDVELASDIVGWYHNKDDLITKELEIKNGCVTVPKGLGLGVELDEKAVAKYGWREPLLTSG